ncbi:MAG: hypothetical protein LBF13_05080, partial [Campylobacteraceae bacterium]|nr:hypothetical protein [Campylobacteraceae bacterium]
MLKDLYVGVQNEMLNNLNISKIINHNVEKGNASENNWIEWFNTYLPKRYHTDKAFVIDSNDKVSEQIDIVI